MKKNSRSPNMRSPATKSSATTHYTARAGASRNLDITEESDISEYETEKGDDSGVRYITESLIQKLSKQENLVFVNSLNLSLSKEGGKKFKFIEALDKCDHLESLNLSHNLIEKIEKMEKLTRLRDLNLSYNRISKLEGLEHMQSLQRLNLSGNEIEHVPAWVGKKLRSLNVLNLKQNKIYSLQDIARLKPLKDLTSLSLAENPVANLPHYRLFAIFHLRSLNSLDGQQISNQERHEARERFNIEEVEKLERDLEKRIREVEELQTQKGKVLTELQNQEEVNKSLRRDALQQQKIYKELQREMDTKNEILKQKTLELTRACQKQYELEQELAFYKIDAKFEPLGYMTSEEADVENSPGESPYIGKARYKRNQYAQEDFIVHGAQQLQVGQFQHNDEDQIRNQQIRARMHTALDVDLSEKERNVQAAQTRLSELGQEIVQAEQQILKATEELRELEAAAAQRKISEAEKEKLRQQLSSKIQLLNQLRQETEELERQMDHQRGEIDRRQREIEELQRHLEALSPWDPRHSHVKAQKASKKQQLEMMDGHYKQLEGRLDDMLSRIARETEEIKDLEQQLTEGQIAANEALKKDLEGIISGLQEYLESIKGQARQAHDECRELRSEREELLQRLEEMEEERERLEAAAQDVDDMRKEIEALERSLQEQQEANDGLRQMEGDLGAYETQLKARDEDIAHLRQELNRAKRHGEALQAQLDKEKRVLENAQEKDLLLQEKDRHNNKLLSQVQQLQRESASLRTQLESLQAKSHDLLHPEEVMARLSELKRKLQTGVGEIRCSGPSDILGLNLVELQQEMNKILKKAEEEKRQAQERERCLQQEMADLQAKAREAPGDYKRACNKAAEAKIQIEKRQHEAREQELENTVRQLQEKLATMEEIQGLADQQLVEAEEERERLLAELRDLENERKMEDARAQRHFSGLDKELKELKRAVAISDKMAASELTGTKDELRSLHGTVLQINRERAKEMEEAEEFCSRAAQALRDLDKAEAEIELLQEMLQEREKQLHDELQKSEDGAIVSNSQQQEVEKLRRILSQQRTEMKRLRHLLDHITADNAAEMENLLDDIESLQRALSYQNGCISGMRNVCHYVPSPCSNSARDSLSTKDSGVSVQCPMTSSPARRRAGVRKGECVPPAIGHCVYSHRHCHNHTNEATCSDTHSETDAAPCCFIPPPGSVIYTVFPDGTPAPQGTVIYGPPPPAARPPAPGSIIYGPPPIGSQFVPGPYPVLHCNVSAHHDLEKEMTRLEDIIDRLKSRQQKEKKSSARLLEEMEDLQRERESLKGEVKELHRSNLVLKSHATGHLDSLITELDIERSWQHHENIEDEIECIETTLVKRRAELRESDRLLAEVENELKDTQDRTADLIDKYNTAKEHLSQTERDAEELEKRAQETAMNLVKADQQLRVLQANARDLEQHRASQENTLQEINSVISAKDAEFQALSDKIQMCNDRLQKLQDDIQAAELRGDLQIQSIQEAEDLLLDKTASLQRLNHQISAQEEDVLALDRLLGEKKEELHLLQANIEQKKANLQDVLLAAEMDVADKRQEIKELKSALNDLCVQKEDVSAQLKEKRSQLEALKQEVAQEEDNLQTVTAQIHRQKSELKHVLEMQQLEDNELRGLKLQHEKKINDLEETQTLLLKGKLELENLQSTSQRLHSDMSQQRQLLEKDHREIELLMTQMHTLQEKVETLSNEKECLEKSGQELEQKLTRNRRILEDTEERNRLAAATLENLESNTRNLQREINQLSEQRESLKQETADAHQFLEEKKEETCVLAAQVSLLRGQIEAAEKDLQNATKCHHVMKEDTADVAARYKRLKEEELRKVERLRQLKDAIEEAERERSKQEERLQQILKDIPIREEQLRQTEAKLEAEKEKLEHQSILEMMNRKEKCCSMLEESLTGTRERLREKTYEVLLLQREMETCRKDLSDLQNQVAADRRRDERRVAMLQETAANQRILSQEAAMDQQRENSYLKKQLMLVEQTAHDNQERAKSLLKELKQLEAEHAALRRELKSQEDLDKRQQEVNEAVRELKAHVKVEIQSTLLDLQCTEDNDLAEDVGELLEQNQSRRSQLHALKESFPFSANPVSKDRQRSGSCQDEHWRGDALREKLQQHEDRLKAELHQRMSTQAATLSRGRQQTEGSLRSLKRRVDALDELVGNISADAASHSQALSTEDLRTVPRHTRDFM